MAFIKISLNDGQIAVDTEGKFHELFALVEYLHLDYRMRMIGIIQNEVKVDDAMEAMKDD